MVDISNFSLDILREDRTLDLDENFQSADAFQRLCHELLSHRLRKNDKLKIDKLIPFTTNGPDGAIDSYGYIDSRNTLIVECKKNENLDAAKKEVKKLSKKLHANLSKPNAANTRYGPWFSTALKKYIYCVSCTLKNAAEYENLKSWVREMIDSLSGIEVLAHLKELEVEIYAWNELRDFLTASPFHYHRWVKERIPGCESLIGYINPKRLRYKAYLYSAKLPYISRDEYKKNNPAAVDLITETGILEQLLDLDIYDGYVIYGEGGIGKTRLMLELGLRAEEKEWTVFKVTSQLESLSHLESYLKPGHNYLLIFDYIEENPLFTSDIIEKLESIAPHANVKVIGNCRRSYIDRSDFKDSPDFMKTDLTLTSKEDETAYKNDTVKKILGEISRFFKVEEEFYRLRPAYAVFLRFLNEKYKKKSSFADFKNFDSFRGWLKRRLTLTFDEDSFDDLQKEIFYLFTALPAQGEITEKLCARYKDQITDLKKDGWLEDDEDNRSRGEEFKNELRVIHDTLAEEILTFRLEKYAPVLSALKAEIKNIFDFALEFDCFENCFRVFDRAVDWQGFAGKKDIFYDIFSGIIREKPELCGSGDQFITTSLLEEDAAVELLVENFSFFKDRIESFGFGLKLSLKMKNLSKQEIGPGVKENTRKLLDAWIFANRDFFKSSYISVRVLSSFLLFFGLEERFGEEKEKAPVYVNKWLNRYGHRLEASFVIKSWLAAGGEIDLVRSYVSPWLKKFPLEIETEFVIKSWLDAGGEKEIVREYVTPWLKEFPLKMETSFVIKSWLNAGGEKEIVRDYVTPWLKEFPLKMETRFVIQSWLAAGGEKEIVRDYVTPWLKEFPLEEEKTSFVIKSWLDAGGEKEIVREYVSPWLKEFPLKMETSFVIQSWLDAGGEKEIVREYVTPWLKEFPLKMETSFVIQSWLDAGGEKEIVREYVTPWLEEFPLEEENTSFVIRCWLDAGGEPEVVEKFVTRWLEKYQNSFEASYVIKSWIKRTNDIGPIKEFAHHWLLLFKDDRQADFVIKRFCRFPGIPQDVLDAAIHWCQKYPDNSEELYTLSYLSRHHINNEKFAAPWLIDLLTKWLSREKLSNHDIRNLEVIMLNISKNKEFSRSAAVVELIKKWFLSPHSFRPFTLHGGYVFLQRRWNFAKYSSLITAGLVDCEKDEDKIKKFLNWVNKWQPGNKKSIKRNIETLEKNLPQYNHLWELVRFDSSADEL
ncbi:MAG: hypothetical protein KAW12_06935 [Candidatus Aminicenantes bacterium]|nr:hypothetical protein [Candidatus Aminicenantes bacterium]